MSRIVFGSKRDILVMVLVLVSVFRGFSSAHATNSPSISTQVSSSSIMLGGAATDTATLSGGLNLTGTVTFNAYSDSSCADARVRSRNRERRVLLRDLGGLYALLPRHLLLDGGIRRRLKQHPRCLKLWGLRRIAHGLFRRHHNIDNNIVKCDHDFRLDAGRGRKRRLRLCGHLCGLCGDPGGDGVLLGGGNDAHADRAHRLLRRVRLLLCRLEFAEHRRGLCDLVHLHDAARLALGNGGGSISGDNRNDNHFVRLHHNDKSCGKHGGDNGHVQSLKSGGGDGRRCSDRHAANIQLANRLDTLALRAADGALHEHRLSLLLHV